MDDLVAFAPGVQQGHGFHRPATIRVPIARPDIEVS